MSSKGPLHSAELMDRLIHALDYKEPLSVVSVGQTEAFVMAQYAIYSEEEFMSHREAYNANRGETKGFFHRGIRFPNREARDATVEAVKKADVIGYNLHVETARVFTERVFSAYNIEPRCVFEANIRRVFMYSQEEKCQEMLRERKILLIGSLAAEAAAVLNARLKSKLGFNIVGALPIYEYEEISDVQRMIADYDFDLCFLAAGVNAVILASFIAEKYGKVAFDIGWGMQSMIKGYVTIDSWVSNHIGIENLFRM
ncbi:MAG TPA: GT-D fold domain-containing glycosyltransferase [Syntrophomonadaceae bacterium]|nr:GT-D fold domain-containing glycosyltransferase [Syntrophomonadaceae bacterium]